MYRQHFQGNDIASSFSVPFPNNRPAHVQEGRFSARQSRLSMLAEGQVNPNVKLSFYTELDFLGGAQTANSNESNSYNPRVRNVYGTIDWTEGDHGWHLLAGQSWSLVTMSTKGITPRNELTPPQIDAQYIPGFAWTRQPQIRLTEGLPRSQAVGRGLRRESADDLRWDGARLGDQHGTGWVRLRCGQYAVAQSCARFRRQGCL